MGSTNVFSGGGMHHHSDHNKVYHKHQKYLNPRKRITVNSLIRTQCIQKKHECALNLKVQTSTVQAVLNSIWQCIALFGNVVYC